MGVTEYLYKTRNHSLRTHNEKDIFTKIKDKYLFYFFFLTYLILPSVTTSLFRMYICTNIDPNHEYPDENSYYLDADVRIECYTTNWYRGVIYASIFILVYPIGIPMMYLYLLSTCKEELINRQNVGFVIDRSIDNADDLDRSLGNDPEKMIFQELDEDDVVEKGQSESNNNLSSHALCLNMFWESYKNEYWYWEVIECYRRIILTSLVSIISPGSSLQSLSAILFTLFFIRLYAYFLPYAIHSDNILAELGQGQVFVTFFIALIINSSLLVGFQWRYVLGNYLYYMIYILILNFL